MDILTPPPVAVPAALPRPVIQAPPPLLLPPSAPPGTIDLSAPPGSLDPLAPPWSDVTSSMPLTSCPLCSISPPLWLRWLHPPAGSALALSCPVSTSWLHLGECRCSVMASEVCDLTQDHLLFVCALGSSTICCVIVHWHGGWLLPPSILPWDVIQAELWAHVGLNLLLVPLWLLLPHHGCFCLYLHYWPALCQLLVLLQIPSLLSWTLRREDSPFQKGSYVTFMFCFCWLFSRLPAYSH